SHSNENFFKSGFFVLIEESTGYKVSVGNFVTQEMRIDLEKKINQVNEMNEEQLKNTYREIITSTDISAKAGASLGLIDMALKSGNKLHYTFNQHKSSNNFFILDILINN
ncbi:MAG TPA: DUF6272 family protein, partial [Vicingus sp.]|nr:DUF6272 family protein [Vicingus sp.]